MADKGEGKGPDNNKRLALLETSVLAIAATLVNAGLLEDDSNEDPLEVAKVELERLGRQDLDNASLSAFLLEKGVEPLEGERAVHTAMRHLAALAELVEAAGNSSPDEAAAALEEQVRSLTEDLEKAHATIASFDKSAASKHRKGPKSSKARKVSPVEPAEGALGEAMEAGEELELVFSNGSHEIVEFDPIRVFAPAFQKQGASRFLLRDAILVKGAGEEKRVRGVGLFAGGKQVAWCGFPRAVPVPVGAERKFDRMIVFG